MKSGFFLNVVITKGSSIFQLLASKDEALLVWRNAFLVLDLRLHVFNGITCFNFQRNSLASQCLDKDLHSSPQTQNQMKSRFLLDVIVTERTPIFQLFASKNEPLLVGRNTFFVLNFCFNVFNGVAGLHLKSNGLAGKGLDEDLHASSQSKNEVESRFLLNVVVAESSAVFQLFTSKDKTLLIWRNAFLVLDFRLDVFDGIARLYFERDCLASERLDKDLHASSQPQYQMKSRFLLNIVVTQSAAVFELFASKDEPLLIGRDSLFVLDFRFDILNGVAGLDLERYCLPGECFDEDLHAATQAENQMKCRFFLDVVVAQSAAIFELFASEDETLLVGRDSFLVLDFGLHVFNGVARLDF